MQRRPLLLGLGGAAAALLLARRFPALAGAATQDLDSTDIERMRQDWRKLVPADAELPTLDTPLQMDQAAWREQLSVEAYRVLFQEGTEPAFTSPLNDEKRHGVFVCAACQLPLFTSAMKYDSGTGWPSFFTVIPDHVGTKTDYKLVWPRTEYHCARCGGHQGHVFEDGPSPTNLRYCNNGVALGFLPADTEEALT